MMRKNYFLKKLNMMSFCFVVFLLSSAFMGVHAQTTHEYAVEDVAQLVADMNADTYDEYVLSTSGGVYVLPSKVTAADSIALIGKADLAARPVISLAGNSSAYGGMFDVGTSMAENVCIRFENLELDNTGNQGYITRSRSKTDFVIKNCYIHGSANSNGSLRLEGEGTTFTMENTLVSDCSQRFIHFYDATKTYGAVVFKNSSFNTMAGPVLYFRSSGTVAIGTDLNVDHCTFNSCGSTAEGVLKLRDMTGTVSVTNSIFSSCLGSVDDEAGFVTPDYCYVAGLETASTATNSIETAPVYADAAANNLMLTNSSDLTGGDSQILGDLSWYTDTFAPIVLADLEKVDNTHLTVVFNEMVDAATAELVANYTLSGTFGLSGNPSSATLSDDAKSVSLEVADLSAITSGQSVVVTVSGVTDLMGNAVDAENVGTYTYLDEVAPVVTMAAQSLTNDDASVAVMQSNETGMVYLILETAAQATLEDFAAAIAAGQGATAVVDAVDTDVNVSLAMLEVGNYKGYAVDGYNNISVAGADMVAVSDVTAPTVGMEVQERTNAAKADPAIATTTERGAIYLILDGEAQATVADFEAAITAMKGAKSDVAYGETSAEISTAGLEPGMYYAYATDLAGNISGKSTNAVTVIKYVPRVRKYAAEEAAQLSADIVAANDGDVFILTTSGGAYEMAYWNKVSADITIMADEDLEERPIISNYVESSTTQNFRFYEAGASMTLKGIEIDNSGNGSYPIKYMIRIASNIGAYSLVAEDCYFHGEMKSGGAMVIAYGGTHADSLIFRNCIFDGTIALKMMGLSSEDSPTWDKFEVSNCTFMNIPERVIAVKDQPAINSYMPIDIDHCTFYNVSSTDDKLFESDSLARVSITNSLFAEVANAAPFTVFGDDTYQSELDYFNVFNCAVPLADKSGVVGTNNWNLDPQFADAANGDLTLGNAGLLALGSDGLPLGDLRWADVLGPKVLPEVMALTDSTLLLTFSEWIDTTSAENPANYTLSGSAGLTGNVKKAEIYNFRKVVVTTESFLDQKDNEVVVTVAGVADLKGNAVGSSDNSVTYVVEQFMPIVFADAQTVTNAADQLVVAQGSLGSGYIYIILDGEAQATVAEMDAAVAAGNGAKAASTASYTDIQVSTFEITPGTYYAYLVDGTGVVSVKGENAITVTDGIAPEVSANVQGVDNGADSEVFVQSSEGTGKVYIILDGENQTISSDFILAVALKKAATAPVLAADTDVAVSTDGLVAGIYYAYAFDAAGNISAKGTNPINITEATAINDLEEFELRVMSANQRIMLVVDGSKMMDNVSIYNITGALVSKTKCASNTFESEVMNSGIYIVRVSSGASLSKTIKVLVK